MVTTLRLTTVMVHSSQGYRMQVGGRVTVGQVAGYLSQYETYIEASTLEVARLVQNPQRLQELDIQAGDRLLVFTQPPKYAELSPSLRPGDKIVKFSLGDFEVNSRGKRSLLVGKPDESQQLIPDIDLRYFVLPESLEFISRNSMWLNFDEGSQIWYATKAGQTRILIDEFELGGGGLPLNKAQRVRFYRAADDPAQKRSQAIGELTLTVEEAVQYRATTAHIEAGDVGLHLRVGLERDSQTLRASHNLRAGQLVSSLATYNGASLTPDLRLYLMRLVPPDVWVGRLHLDVDEFLYTALNLHYTRNLLLLHDIHNPERVYTLSAGREDVTKIIGCRADSDEAPLDADLYEAIIGQGYDPQPFSLISPYYAHIAFRAAEHSWAIWSDERAAVPLFVNNLRATSSAAIQLTSGDVLSFGPSVNQYYARLEVEVRF